MTTAIKSSISTETTNTKASIIANIKLAMQSLGFTNPYDEFTGTAMYYGGDAMTFLVYEKVYDESKTKGKAYWVIGVSDARRIQWAMADGWDAVNHIGSNLCGYSQYSYQPDSTAYMVYDTLQHPEFLQLKISWLQNNNWNSCSTSLLRPDKKPTWWDENRWLYAFVQGYEHPHFTSAASNPWGTNTAYSTQNLQLGYTSFLKYANPYNAKRDIVPGVMLFDTGSTGLGGRLSEDFVLVAGVGLSYGDVLQIVPNVEEYAFVTSYSNCGFAVRSV